MRRPEGSTDPEAILATWRKLTEDVRESLEQDDISRVLAALDARDRWISAYGEALSRALAESPAVSLSLQERLLAEEEALRNALEERRRALFSALEDVRTLMRAEQSYAAESREEGGPFSGGLVDRRG
ncbi:hypothetical protein [Brockia lithotrophica]|uniref:Flagellar protein FliT n=1 Tax=Brockia lithotrophica TaxID=933949 RepID=A0A660KXG0_9BACL|nr:hypothetical protein [Brockia lithotrophica]RKQ85480.1 hypothetical protein C7438_0874 [Brockia lithotrophica]